MSKQIVDYADKYYSDLSFLTKPRTNWELMESLTNEGHITVTHDELIMITKSLLARRLSYTVAQINSDHCIVSANIN